MMTVMAPVFGEPYTLADVESFPDDGQRYELVDGMLIVTPPPTMLHQLAASTLARVLHEARPSGFLVFAAPIAVQRRPGSHLEPDVSVIRRDDYGKAPTDVVAEILSPSTRRYDRLLKAEAYAAMGVPSYWLVDPAAPGITILEHAPGGSYQTVAEIKGEERYDVTRPYPVRLVASDVLADLRT